MVCGFSLSLRNPPEGSSYSFWFAFSPCPVLNDRVISITATFNLLSPKKGIQVYTGVRGG